jgi:hypothetical protein
MGGVPLASRRSMVRACAASRRRPRQQNSDDINER